MLEWTGERFLPWMEGAQIHYEHLHRYSFASHLVEGKSVLDLACGEGYGSYMLSKVAEQVIGIEIDEQVVTHAKKRYLRDNLEFMVGSVINIPIKEKRRFDVAVCFECIEHISEHNKLTLEVKRLLKDDGLFILSTPNKASYTDEPNFDNLFHVQELYLDEFRKLLSNYFKHVYFLGQRVYAGSNLWDISSKEHTNYDEFIIERGDREFHFLGNERKTPLYYIALASDASLESNITNVNSWLVDISDSLMKTYQKEITELRNALQAKEKELLNWREGVGALLSLLQGLGRE